MNPWAGFKPLRKPQPEESRWKTALWLLVLVSAFIYCLHRAVSGRDNIFDRPVVALSTEAINRQILGERSDRPWVVTLWAPFCPVCREFSDEFNVVARDFSPDISFGHVNLEEYPEVGSHYQVFAIPTVLLIRNGGVIATQPGAMSRSELAWWIDSNLAK